MRWSASGLFLCLVLVPAVSFGGVITNLNSVHGPVGEFDGIVSDLNDPNNDNVVGASPNSIVASGSLEFLAAGPIDFVIDAQNSGGTTEYFADFGTALNSTSSEWIGFRFLLGIGFGDSFTRLSELGSNPFTDGLDADFPDQDLAPSTSVFDLLSWDADSIVFLGGGTLPPGATGVGSDFSLDVPDFVGASTFQFTIRAEPLIQQVPEPRAIVIWALLLFGGVGVGCCLLSYRSVPAIDKCRGWVAVVRGA